MASAKKSRKATDKTPFERRLRKLMTGKAISSIAELERIAGVKKDSISNLVRGKVKRNSDEKIRNLYHIAILLDADIKELAELAGLLDRSKVFDFGTDENRIRKTMLARGGDPNLCSFPMGVMHAQYQGTGRGLNQKQFYAGQYYAHLRYRSMPTGGPRKPRTAGLNLAYPDMGFSQVSDDLKTQMFGDMYRLAHFKIAPLGQRCLRLIQFVIGEENFPTFLYRLDDSVDPDLLLMQAIMDRLHDHFRSPDHYSIVDRYTELGVN